MWRRFFAWISRNERHVSAAAMIAGFIIDNIFFTRIDLLRTQAVFIAYIVICVYAIAHLHRIEAKADLGVPRPRWRSVLPIATQFSLGGMWSGYLIFYTRSASLGASWPFLILLFTIFVGNEVFKKYHDRLIFTTVLFFFGLYSYAIFALPVVTHTIGTATFLESGAAAILFFGAFLALLRILGNKRFLQGAWPIRIGAAVVLIVINLAYFTNVLPPLPLSLKSGGIYHYVSHDASGYHGTSEEQPWYTALGFPEIIHTTTGESVYAYSAVFAPIQLTAIIVHQWQWYDPVKGQWITQAAIAFPIVGGRDGGYKGYSAKANLVGGLWRVNIETSDGLTIGRLSFRIVPAALPVPVTSALLN